MPQRPPWTWGSSPQNEAFTAYVDQRMADLESYLRDLHQEVSFGPVAGSYVTINLIYSSSAGLGVGGVADAVGVEFEFRPIFLSAFCTGGNMTVRVRESTLGTPTNLMVSDIALVGGNVQTFRNRSDFNLEKVTGEQVEISPVSIDSGTPKHLHVFLLGKNVSKVEPA